MLVLLIRKKNIGKWERVRTSILPVNNSIELTQKKKKKKKKKMKNICPLRRSINKVVVVVFFTVELSYLQRQIPDYDAEGKLTSYIIVIVLYKSQITVHTSLYLAVNHNSR